MLLVTFKFHLHEFEFTNVTSFWMLENIQKKNPKVLKGQYLD